MKSHSPQLERHLRIKPEALEMLDNDPVWQRIWARLLTPRPDRDERADERRDHYADANTNDR